MWRFNGRAWGSMALARRQALEYPGWTVMQALDPGFSLDVPTPVREGLVCRHLGRELMHLLFVLRGSRSKAIRHWPGVGETLRALRSKYPTEKVWAIFEPRTNTTRRNTFQAELADAFADANAVVVAQVSLANLHHVPPVVLAC